ncbi:MAG TPA: dienelactone hydrolase family protein [Gemmataceae bacterium]|jgi:dienelactone hydrolase|nr:dienelactone hydrolase family protein [Gemmataceae bacterium]
MGTQTLGPPVEHPVVVRAGQAELQGTLALPQDAFGVVVFAHGSGSGRHSPRNQFVARVLREAGLGTLLLDLLTAEEDAIDARTAEFRFDIALLAERVVGATDWLSKLEPTAALPVGYFGASTGAGAALVAAARRPERVKAVVSRGGRPDLADNDLPRVQAATLLIVGGNDEPVIGLNRQALDRLGSREKGLHIVPGATHLFEEPGTLEEVARLAADWFARHLAGRPAVV